MPGVAFDAAMTRLLGKSLTRTHVSPQDKGAMGNVDRGAAVVNGALITADMVMITFPRIGEVALAATGMSLAGPYTTIGRHSTMLPMMSAVHRQCD